MTKLNFDLTPIGGPAANNPGHASASNPIILIAGTALLIKIFSALMSGAI